MPATTTTGLVSIFLPVSNPPFVSAMLTGSCPSSGGCQSEIASSSPHAHALDPAPDLFETRGGTKDQEHEQDFVARSDPRLYNCRTMLPAFSLVIPAYNEAERIGQTLRDALGYLETTSARSELIVVNDGSTDATSEIVREVFAARTGVNARLLEHSPNRGKGAAVRQGLLAATTPIGLFSDADLSTPIDEAAKLIEPIAAGELDVAFGSRGLDRSLIGERQPWRREQGGRVFNLIVRLATGLPYWDTQCGFKAFRLDVFRPVLERAKTDGFGFDVELLYLARQANLRMREIPVRWNHVEGSKVSFLRDSLRMLREIAALRKT
jgi:glycosyltransferase involved in cell wall biosynthesis